MNQLELLKIIKDAMENLDPHVAEGKVVESDFTDDFLVLEINGKKFKINVKEMWT